MTEKARIFYQLTVGRILVAKVASAKGGEGLPCVGPSWLQAHPQQDTAEPMSQAGGTSGKLW